MGLNVQKPLLILYRYSAAKLKNVIQLKKLPALSIMPQLNFEAKLQKFNSMNSKTLSLDMSFEKKQQKSKAILP